MTTWKEGIIVGIILLVIAYFISHITWLVTPPEVDIDIFTALVVPSIIMGIGIGIVTGIVTLLAVGGLAAMFTKNIAQGRCDVYKTIGFLGYTHILGVVINIILILVSISLNVPFISQGSFPDVSEFMPLILIVAIMLIIHFVWSLWIGGSAVSVANDVSFRCGVVSYLLAGIIVALAIQAVVFSIGIGWVWMLH
jgi:hypothetical protein